MKSLKRETDRIVAKHKARMPKLEKKRIRREGMWKFIYKLFGIEK